MYKDDGFYKDFYEDFIKSDSLEKDVKYLSIQIYELHKYLECLHELIPIKYKKTNPKPGENPFFSKNVSASPTKEEIESAILRMEEFLKQSTKPPT